LALNSPSDRAAAISAGALEAGRASNRRPRQGDMERDIDGAAAEAANWRPGIAYEPVDGLRSAG